MLYLLPSFASNEISGVTIDQRCKALLQLLCIQTQPLEFVQIDRVLKSNLNPDSWDKREERIKNALSIHINNKSPPKGLDPNAFSCANQNPLLCFLNPSLVHLSSSYCSSSSQVQSSYFPSGMYRRTIRGIFFSRSSLMAIWRGSVAPSVSTRTGAFILQVKASQNGPNLSQSQ